MELNNSDKDITNDSSASLNQFIKGSQEDLIHQLQEVNDKLVISENLKTYFLSNIRNEINNPLASVLELSKSIANGFLDPAQVKRYASMIHSELFNLDFQLRNIFASAEIEAGEVALNAGKTNVSAIMRSVVESFKHVSEKQKITILLTDEIPADKLFSTDSAKLHLVISNILGNAIRFSDEGSAIRIDMNIIDDQLKIVIQDFGMGISEENRKLIFDRFRQGQEGSTKVYSGHGLGLSISRAILEVINGDLLLETEVSNGSIFTILVYESRIGEDDGSGFSEGGNDFLFTDADILKL
jgi:signal transduction histidine kinase